MKFSPSMKSFVRSPYFISLLHCFHVSNILFLFLTTFQNYQGQTRYSRIPIADLQPKVFCQHLLAADEVIDHKLYYQCLIVCSAPLFIVLDGMQLLILNIYSVFSSKMHWESQVHSIQYPWVLLRHSTPFSNILEEFLMYWFKGNKDLTEQHRCTCGASLSSISNYVMWYF